MLKAVGSKKEFSEPSSNNTLVKENVKEMQTEFNDLEKVILYNCFFSFKFFSFFTIVWILN